jgi:hypothetical protein
MVQRVVCEHRYALVRDLLALNRRAEDLFTPRLSFYELTCIIVAAPPNSSIRYFLDGGWSREAQLLANMQEQSSGFSKLPAPYERPGQTMVGAEGQAVSMDNPFGAAVFKAEPMEWDEMTARLEERYANARPTVGGGSKTLGRY